MTEKNILQNWFVTGAKPTQEQFWAWQESYWHKGENIPTEKILGLSEVLANKADVEILQHKANLDTSNLTNEYVLAWKKALGVGELPSNIATIDEGEKHGNTYTKTKVDELLENSGKNLGNADLQVPAGVVRTLNVEGAKFQISGLANKKTDASFSRRLKTNERGEIGYSDEADVIVNIPERFASTGSIANTTITVNHIFPNAIPERPNFAEEIQKIMAKYSTYDFTPIVGSNYTLWTKDNLGTDVNTISTNGEVVLKGINEWNSVSGQIVLKGKANLVLPADKDWILKINAQKIQVRRARNLLFGVCRTNEDVVQYGGAISGYDYHGQNPEFDILNHQSDAVELNVVKEKSALSGKKWDKATKNLTKNNIIKVEKIDDVLLMKLV